MHIGNKITEVLKQRHSTKQALGRSIGLTGSSATYLSTRPSIDVETLQKISNVLKYNFFKHYPVEEAGEGSFSFTTEKIVIADEKDKVILEMKGKILELEKNLEACKRDLVMQKQENVYLKKINELLDKKG